MVADERLFGEEMAKEMVALRDMILGPRDMRTADKPYRDQATGDLVGGTAYERFGVEGARDGGRAYNEAITCQQQTGIVAPGVNVKSAGEETEHDELRQRLVHLCTEAGMVGAKCIADCDELKTYRETIGAPIIGHESNCMFDSIQMNISRATAEDEGKKTALQRIEVSDKANEEDETSSGSEFNPSSSNEDSDNVDTQLMKGRKQQRLLFNDDLGSSSQDCDSLYAPDPTTADVPSPVLRCSQLYKFDVVNSEAEALATAWKTCPTEVVALDLSDP
ncbi:hypothetical protein DENSPDRAFT_887262 [Dentipellis sp. KUC8613]|nr:hypothetical protein DENSPDRAFT_887262 [Dentipellis sp. KUC8613]